MNQTKSYFYVLQKKQAVRRLSHGSGGQGNRKLDIRRKLEANRRVAGTGSTAGERRGTRGNLKSGLYSKGIRKC